MTEPITIRSYSDLIEAMRSKIAADGLTHKSVDEIVDWAPGYAGKVLGPTPMKTLSVTTMFYLLDVCGYAISLVPDEAAARRTQKAIAGLGGIKQRDSGKVRPNVRMGRIPWLINSKNAAEMVALRMQKVPPEQRQRLARKAAKSRWKKQRRLKRELRLRGKEIEAALPRRKTVPPSQ